MTLQEQITAWATMCFGKDHVEDISVRSMRFLEEALELAQACGITETEAERVKRYVYARPVGVLPDEIGGTYLTLAVLSSLVGEDMDAIAKATLAKNVTRTERIREKDRAKPNFKDAVR